MSDFKFKEGDKVRVISSAMDSDIASVEQHLNRVGTVYECMHSYYNSYYNEIINSCTSTDGYYGRVLFWEYHLELVERVSSTSAQSVSPDQDFYDRLFDSIVED